MNEYYGLFIMICISFTLASLAMQLIKMGKRIYSRLWWFWWRKRIKAIAIEVTCEATRRAQIDAMPIKGNDLFILPEKEFKVRLDKEIDDLTK